MPGEHVTQEGSISQSPQENPAGTIQVSIHTETVVVPNGGSAAEAVAWVVGSNLPLLAESKREFVQELVDWWGDYGVQYASTRFDHSRPAVKMGVRTPGTLKSRLSMARTR